MDISKVYDLSNSSATIEIPYTISGYGIKTMEWYLDGELINSNNSEDIITDSIANKTKYLTINGLNSGIHTL
jgi:hypothetical protein